MEKSERRREERRDGVWEKRTDGPLLMAFSALPDLRDGRPICIHPPKRRCQDVYVDLLICFYMKKKWESRECCTNDERLRKIQKKYSGNSWIEDDIMEQKSQTVLDYLWEPMEVFVLLNWKQKRTSFWSVPGDIWNYSCYLRNHPHLKFYKFERENSFITCQITYFDRTEWMNETRKWVDDGRNGGEQNGETCT